MRLEQAAGLLRPIPDAREKAMLNLAFTYNVILERTLSALKPFDLNDQHYNILKIVAEQHPEPVSVGSIKARLLDKRGDLTRLLDKLVAIKLVDRGQNPDNRRVVNVWMTTKGLAELSQMDAALTSSREHLANLTEAEARQLNDLLDQLRG